MNGDLLVRIGKNRGARKLIQGLGLPIPLPRELERANAAWEAKPLAGRLVSVGHAPGGGLGELLVRALTDAGAQVRQAEDPSLEKAQRKSGAAVKSQARLWALVFDATGIGDAAGLRSLYDFFHPIARSIAPSGRVLILGRPHDGAAPVAAAAAQAALEGFARSLAKELGRQGATVNLLRVETGAEEWAEGPIRFLLSPRSAFVTAQPLTVSKHEKSSPNRQNGSNGHHGNGAGGHWVRSLEGKVALVTGAARGIGEATARLLAQEGAKVFCLDRPEDQALAEKLAAAIGGAALGIDLARPEAAARVAEEARTRFGGLDIVVNNAGIIRDKTITRMSTEQWDQVVEVNLAAILRLTDALTGNSGVGRGSRPDGGGVLRDGGRVICLSSIAGIAGNPGQTNYAATKAGVIGFVRALAPRLASRGTTVNAIAPGFIETRLTASIPLLIRESGRRMCALGQGGLPSDVGQAISFLASPGAQGVTGQVLRVCGGSLVGA